MDIFGFVRNINGIVKFCYGLCDREMPRRYVLSSNLVYDDPCRIIFWTVVYPCCIVYTYEP